MHARNSLHQKGEQPEQNPDTRQQKKSKTPNVFPSLRAPQLGRTKLENQGLLLSLKFHSCSKEVKRAKEDVNEEWVSLQAAAGVESGFQAWSKSSSAETEAVKRKRPQTYALLIKTT